MTVQQRRRSTIGFDYGTYSTKVVHRIRNQEYGRVIHFDDPCHDYPVNASPSAIRNIDGRLYFGTQAIHRDDGEDYGSFKADLLTPPDDPELSRSMEVLIAAYFAWALGRILKQYPSLAADEPVIQFSAPTSHASHEVLNQIYLRIAHACYAISCQGKGVIDQGVCYDEAAKLIRPLLEAPIPSSGNRKFFILPETVAPIVSLQLEPFLEPGIYLIADMGASTTEMSVFAVNDKSAGNSILGYFDLTEIRGGNDLLSIGDKPTELFREEMAKFLGAMKKQANKVWYSGYQRDMPNHVARKRWESLEVLLTGGATHHTSVRKHFDEKINPMQPWPTNETSMTVGRHIPTTLICDPGLNEEDLSLFAVANGLAVERPRWPRFYGEDEIPSLDPDDSIGRKSFPSYLDIC